MTPPIAVVDDDRDIRELLCALLGDLGYRTRAYPSAASARPGLLTERPALLVLDIRLETPQAGWCLLQHLRGLPALAALPVLVCSADATFLERRAPDLAAQGCGVLAKPFDIADFCAQAERLLATPGRAAPAPPLAEEWGTVAGG